MPGHQVIIGSGETQWTFASKQDAIATCRAMLARYRNNEDIREEDSEFLRALVQRHPESVQKIGLGIKRFFRAGTGQSTDCFWLERIDGSTTDFSYKSCVNAKGKSLYQEFAEACRQAVQADLTRAKKEHFEKFGDADGKVPCDVTGDSVSISEAHLDHKKPLTFQVIVMTFVKALKIQIRPEMLSIPTDAQFVTTFVDKELEAAFREYHHTVRILRIVKARTNLSLGGSERITHPKHPVVLDSDD
jgi:hypothetical protein